MGESFPTETQPSEPVIGSYFLDGSKSSEKGPGGHRSSNPCRQTVYRGGHSAHPGRRCPEASPQHPCFSYNMQKIGYLIVPEVKRDHGFVEAPALEVAPPDDPESAVGQPRHQTEEEQHAGERE